MLLRVKVAYLNFVGTQGFAGVRRADDVRRANTQN